MSAEKGPPAKCRTLKKETPLIRAAGPIHSGVAEVLQRPVVGNERPLEARGYTRIKQIGKGAFGRAILVRNVKGELQVAKEINLLSIAPHEKDMARTEIKVLRTLDHPNVIRYMDHFEENGLLYIIMEYADAGDLGRLLRGLQQPLPEGDILDIFVQVCLAMAHVHERHILHRDIKPANIFLAKGRKVSKLGDFGISTVLRGAHASAKAQCGTPYYFSPEVCQQQSYNTKSDVWSLGCLLYEMLTLKRPFNAPNLKTLMTTICKGAYPPIGDHYSKEMHQLIAQMLTRDPEHRPAISQILTLPFIRAHVQQPVPALPKPLDAQADKQRLMSKLMDALGKPLEAADCPAAPRERPEVRYTVAQRRPHSSGPVLRHARETPPEPPKEKTGTVPIVAQLQEQVHAILRPPASTVAKPATHAGPKPAAEAPQQYITVGDLPEADAAPPLLLRNGININFNINVSNNNFTTTHNSTGALVPRDGDHSLQNVPTHAPGEVALGDSEVYRSLMADIQRHLPGECSRGPLDQLWRAQAQFISQQLAARCTRPAEGDAASPAPHHSCPRADLDDNRSDKPSSLLPQNLLAGRLLMRRRRQPHPAQVALGVRDAGPDARPLRPASAPAVPERVALPQASPPEVSRAKSKYLQAIQDALGYAAEGDAAPALLPSPTPALEPPHPSRETTPNRARPADGSSARGNRDGPPYAEPCAEGAAGSHPLHAIVDLLLGEGAPPPPPAGPTSSAPQSACLPPAPEPPRVPPERLWAERLAGRGSAVERLPSTGSAGVEHQEQLLEDLLAAPVPAPSAVPGKPHAAVQHPRVQLPAHPAPAPLGQPRARHLQAPGPADGPRERYHRCRRSSSTPPADAPSQPGSDAGLPREARTAEQQQLLRHLRLQQEQQVRRLQQQQQQWRLSQKAAAAGEVVNSARDLLCGS
eukprot:EG_transcript_2033